MSSADSCCSEGNLYWTNLNIYLYQSFKALENVSSGIKSDCFTLLGNLLLSSAEPSWITVPGISLPACTHQLWIITSIQPPDSPSYCSLKCSLVSVTFPQQTVPPPPPPPSPLIPMRWDKVDGDGVWQAPPPPPIDPIFTEEYATLRAAGSGSGSGCPAS